MIGRLSHSFPPATRLLQMALALARNPPQTIIKGALLSGPPLCLSYCGLLALDLQRFDRDHDEMGRDSCGWDASWPGAMSPGKGRIGIGVSRQVDYQLRQG